MHVCYGIWKGRQKERQVSLKTRKKVVAMERLRMVNRYESDIKNGMSFTWPWISNESSVNVKRFTLIDACYKWMQKRQNYRKTTLSINNQGLFYLTDCLGKNTPLESILNTDIDRFIDYLKTKGLSDVSVNIHLRTVKSMFRYWLKRERLTKVPLIEQIAIRKNHPIYITDSDFEEIMSLDWLDDFYKRVFLFYRETGLRLREPMITSQKEVGLMYPMNRKEGLVGILSLAVLFVLSLWNTRNGFSSVMVQILKTQVNISLKYLKKL